MQQLICTRHLHARSRAEGTVRASRVAAQRAAPAALGLLIALACAVIPMHAAAGNLNFLNNTPLSFLQPDDVELMKKTAVELLDSGKLNTKQTWSNPKTGASGYAQVTGQFTMADGTHCKRLQLFNKAGGLENLATYPVCKYSDRGWLINADAQPAK